MIRILIFVGTLASLLSGCSQLNPYMDKVKPLTDKIPLLKEEKGNSEKEASPYGNEDGKEDASQNEGIESKNEMSTEKDPL